MHVFSPIPEKGLPSIISCSPVIGLFNRRLLLVFWISHCASRMLLQAWTKNSDITNKNNLGYYFHSIRMNLNRCSIDKKGMGK